MFVIGDVTGFFLVDKFDIDVKNCVLIGVKLEKSRFYLDKFV